MKAIGKTFFTFPTQVYHIVILPVFAVVFVLAYKPEGLGDFLEMGRNLLNFNLTILGFIVLGSIFLTRIAFYLMRESKSLTYQMYAGWCALEILTASLFCALFLTLMYHGRYHYFFVAAKCFEYLFMILLFPYIILSLTTVISDMASEKFQDEVEDKTLIKFLDEYQKLKFVIAAPALLYVEAKENYVKIHYLDGEKIKDYTLRSSMKRLEELLSKHGLVRCQRAYYVNPPHVKVLRRDQNGFIYADLNTNESISIPVSKTYYDRLSSIL